MALGKELESEAIQMLDFIDEDKSTEYLSELGFYLPVSMIVSTLFINTCFEMKDGETCRQLNERICDDKDGCNINFERPISS